MRILVAGFLGAIAMFLWTFVAHMATPLGETGFKQIPNEAVVLQTLDQSIGVQGGLYFYPWVDQRDPDMMKKQAALEKTHPSGLLLYRPAGGGMNAGMAPQLIREFVKQFVQASIAAWLVSMMIGLSYLGRVGAVTATSVIAAIATNVSYWNWYGFPGDFTIAAIIVETGSGIAAGLVIAWWLGRRRA